jgi:tetratricopeptide (TPR) repeat protein
MRKFTVSAILILIFTISLVKAQQTVSDEAVRHMTRGQMAVESAASIEDYKAAIKEFELAKDIAPEWADVYYNLGIVQEKAGDFDGAIRNLQKYLQLAPNAEDAADIKKTIYRIEYQRERGNIQGIWKVDRNELSVNCDPPGGAYGKGHIISAVFLIEDIQLEMKNNSAGLEARILSSKNRFPGTLPDGPFVPVRRDGDVVKIFNVIMYSCKNVISNDNGPWKVKLILKQVSANVLEGTIEVNGIIEKVVNYGTFALEPMGFSAQGKIILRRGNQ